MNRKRDWSWLISVLLITLCAFVTVALYYVVHKPFDMTNITALISSLLDLLIASAVVYVGMGAGLIFLPDDPNISPLERMVLSAGIGLGVLGLSLLALGLVGGYYPWLMWCLLIIGILLSTRRVPPLLNSAWKRGIELPGGRFFAFLALFVGGMLVISLLLALLPPTAWDSLVYHLTGPKWDIQAQRLVGDVDVLHLGFPALIEMLYALGMLLKGSVIAQLLHWTFMLLSVLLLYVFAQRYLDLRVAWLSMALVLSAPTIVLLASWAYIDAALMFFALAAVHTLLLWRDSGRIHWLYIAGLLCGFGMDTKYTAAGLSIALGVVILWESRHQGWRSTIRNFGGFGIMAVVVTLPWLLKNWYFLGNPFYPFLFGGHYWDAFRQLWYSRPGTGLAYTAPWELLAAPWLMTVFSTEGKVGFAATIGPLFLIGLITLVFVWRFAIPKEKSSLRILIWISLIQYAIWLVGVALSAPLKQTRLLLPIFPLLSILAAYALDRVIALRRPAFAIDWILNIVVVLSLSINLLGAGLEVARVRPLESIAGWEMKEDYLTRRLGSHYAIMDYINQELPEDARLYFWWEPRSYYCDRVCRPDAILDAFAHLVYDWGSAPAIAEHIREQGYTHILLFKEGMDFTLDTKSDPITENDLVVFHELERDYLVPVHTEGQSYVLYRLAGQPVGE